MTFIVSLSAIVLMGEIDKYSDEVRKTIEPIRTQLGFLLTAFGNKSRNTVSKK